MMVIEGKGREYDRAGELGDAIIKAIEEHAEGMSLAAIVGTLDLVKLQIVLDAEE